MTGLLEFTLRAAMCRQLAKREPADGVFWMTEAKSRQSREEFRGGPRTKIGSDILSLRSDERRRVPGARVRTRLAAGVAAAVLGVAAPATPPPRTPPRYGIRSTSSRRPPRRRRSS